MHTFTALHSDLEVVALVKSHQCDYFENVMPCSECMSKCQPKFLK